LNLLSIQQVSLSSINLLKPLFIHDTFGVREYVSPSRLCKAEKQQQQQQQQQQQAKAERIK